MDNLYFKKVFGFLKKKRELIHVHGKFPKIKYKDYGGFQTRNVSMIGLINNMFKVHQDKFLGKTFDFYVYTGDKPEIAYSYLEYLNLKQILAFSTVAQYSDKVIPIPDFIYAGWPEVGIQSWEKIVEECRVSADVPYKDNRCFWIGNPKTNMIRSQLIRLSQEIPELLYAVDMTWTEEKIGELQAATKYVSIPDHAAYKSLVDVQGVGWSGRVKLLMHLRRPLYLVDRPYQEFFFQYMRPMIHYIPVSADLSDFAEKLQWLSKNESEYFKLVENIEIFAAKYLNKHFAIEYLSNVVSEYGCKNEGEII